jgi:hypothetical protein
VEGGGGFVGVGEPVQLGEPDRSVGGVEVGQDAAGADGAELLVVADQAHPATPADDMVDHGGEGEGVSHPGFVDQQQRLRADPVGPVGERQLSVDGPGEPVQGVGGDAGGFGELGRGGGGGGEAEDVTAAAGPGVGQDSEGGGLARAGGGDH